MYPLLPSQRRRRTNKSFPSRAKRQEPVPVIPGWPFHYFPYSIRGVISRGPTTHAGPPIRPASYPSQRGQQDPTRQRLPIRLPPLPMPHTTGNNKYAQQDTEKKKRNSLHDAGKWVPRERPKQGPGAARGSVLGDRARRQPRPAPAPLRVSSAKIIKARARRGLSAVINERTSKQQALPSRSREVAPT